MFKEPLHEYDMGEEFPRDVYKEPLWPEDEEAGIGGKKKSLRDESFGIDEITKMAEKELNLKEKLEDMKK